MTKRILSIVAASGLVFVLAASLSAQGIRLRANIPFEFVAGLSTLPAGEYQLDNGIGPGAVRIWSENSHTSSLAVSLAVSDSKVNGQPRLIFHRYGKDLLERVSICGKTGSLSGDTPPGFYDWFVGFAPAEDPRIAFCAMLINQKSWRIKGAFVAQEALKSFFLEPNK